MSECAELDRHSGSPLKVAPNDHDRLQSRPGEQGGKPEARNALTPLSSGKAPPSSQAAWLTRCVRFVRSQSATRRGVSPVVEPELVRVFVMGRLMAGKESGAECCVESAARTLG